MTLSYAVIGTGAIGGYYGGRLAESGCDVHFLLRSDYGHVSAHGMVVDSVKGDFALQPVNAYSSAASMPPVDVALVCLKTTNNHLLPGLLPSLKPGGAVLLLQNGFGVEAAVEQIWREALERVPTLFGGLCFICAHKIAPGHIRHIDYGRLMLGEHIAAVSDQFAPVNLLKAIAIDFNRANIETDITNDLAMARWLKLVWNVPYNALSVVLNATTAEMMADEGTRTLILTLMQEVVSVANRWGEQNNKGEERALSDDVIEQMFEHTETMPAYLTSMKLDFEQKRPLEIETILGTPLKIAKELDVAVPAMDMLYQQLAFLNARNLR